MLDTPSGERSKHSARPTIQDIENFKIPEGFREKGAFTVQLWWIVQSIFFSKSPQFLYGWRRFLLRLFGAKIGKNVGIRPSVRITYPWKLSVGDHSVIGDFVELYTLGRIEIGSNVCISQHAYLCTGSHRADLVSFDIYAEPIIVEDEAWICAGVFVYPGVRVGKGSVVAARSVLMADTEELAVYAGSPATRRGSRI